MYASAASRARTDLAIGLATLQLSGACAEQPATMTDSVGPGDSSCAASVTLSAAQTIRTPASLITPRLPSLRQAPLSPWERGVGDSKCRSADQDRPARVRWRQCAAPTTTDHSNTSASTSANLVLLLPRRQRLGNIPEVKEAGALRDAAAIATAVREASSCVAFATRSAALAASTLVSTHLLTN